MDEAESYLLKGKPFIEKINLFSWQFLTCLYLGEICFEKRKYQECQDYYAKAIWLSELNRSNPSFINLCKLGLAKAKVMKNEKDVDLEPLYRYEDENKVKLYEGWMQRYMGEIFLNIDDQHMNEAEEWIKKAIEADKKNGMMWHLGRDYALYTELFKRKGDQSKAKENLNKAIEILKECGADGWVERYEKELAALA